MWGIADMYVDNMDHFLGKTETLNVEESAAEARNVIMRLHFLIFGCGGRKYVI